MPNRIPKMRTAVGRKTAFYKDPSNNILTFSANEDIAEATDAAEIVDKICRLNLQSQPALAVGHAFFSLRLSDSCRAQQIEINIYTQAAAEILQCIKQILDDLAAQICLPSTATALSTGPEVNSSSSSSFPDSSSTATTHDVDDPVKFWSNPVNYILIGCGVIIGLIIGRGYYRWRRNCEQAEDNLDEQSLDDMLDENLASVHSSGQSSEQSSFNSSLGSAAGSTASLRSIR